MQTCVLCVFVCLVTTALLRQMIAPCCGLGERPGEGIRKQKTEALPTRSPFSPHTAKRTEFPPFPARTPHSLSLSLSLFLSPTFLDTQAAGLFAAFMFPEDLKDSGNRICIAPSAFDCAARLWNLALGARGSCWVSCASPASLAWPLQSPGWSPAWMPCHQHFRSPLHSGHKLDFAPLRNYT